MNVIFHFRYDFIPPIKYNFLNEEEAEEQFEKRNKTLNLFSVMLSKKLRDKGAEEEGGMAGDVGGVEEEAVRMGFKGKGKKKASDGLVSDQQ